ncbi:MAG TPA: DNA internalization-related competence protein ComEC/Rec2 [Thermoanaerobaculia bacterium]|nr:DNA internalization-related competence protein ComEC/Rec2 [Thermoanaerobaculia bacterium]
MNIQSAPLLVPAAALAAGAWLALQLPFLPLPLLVLLAALGLAWGRRAGPPLAALAAGMLVAAATHGLPARPERRIDPGRPAEVSARVSGHWRPDEEGWSAPARVLSLAQGERIEVGGVSGLEIVVHLPGPEAPPPYGSRLALRGYLHRSPGFANRVPVPPGPWRMRLKSRLLLRVEEGPGPLDRLSSRLRVRVEEAYAAAAPTAGPESPGLALARALVLGDPSHLPLAWRRGLAATGLTHLLSVSGLHVALVAALALILGGLLPRPLRRLRPLPAAVAVGAYLLLVGPHPALLRASLMALLALLSLALERPPAAANGLGWAVALLVLWDPAVVERPAFALSAAAAAGVVLLSPPLARRFHRLPLRLGTALAVSLGAMLTALPVALPLFHSLPVLAPLAALVAVPWTGLSLLGSLAWTVLAIAAPALAVRTVPVLDALAAPYGWPAAAGPHLWPSLPLLATVPVAAALAAGLILLLLGGRLRSLAGLLLVALAAWGLAQPFRVPHGRELALLDVGQGDSILLRDGRHAVLVDGGGWEGADFGGRVLLPALLGEGVRHLDAIVMTHPDRDHCGGLADLAAHLPVDAVWTGPGWPATGCAGELFTLPRVRTRLLAPGMALRVGRWRLAVLHAGEPSGDERKVNERSLVLAAEAAGRRVILTGDAGREAEAEMLDRWPAAALRADLLKVGHHGSNGSTGDDLLDAVSPRLALVSVGLANPYHHPSPAVLARLARRGIPVLRTDRSGEVVVRFGQDGRMRVETPGAPR